MITNFDSNIETINRKLKCANRVQADIQLQPEILHCVQNDKL